MDQPLRLVISEDHGASTVGNVPPLRYRVVREATGHGYPCYGHKTPEQARQCFDAGGCEEFERTAYRQQRQRRNERQQTRRSAKRQAA